MENVVIVTKQGYAYILALKLINEELRAQHPSDFSFISKDRRILYSEKVINKESLKESIDNTKFPINVKIRIIQF